MMTMKRKMFAIACVAIGMWSCSNDDVPATGIRKMTR